MPAEKTNAPEATEVTNAPVAPVAPVATEVTEERVIFSLPTLESYIGKDADDVTNALLHRADCKNHANLVVTNITPSTTREGNLTIVCNKALPQFMLDAATGEYVESTTRNVFTTCIQIAAILKGQGEILLAKAVMSGNINIIMAVLKGARVSVISRYMAAGEEYCNPYASKLSDERTATIHDRYQYFMYEITLSHKLTFMEEMQLAKMLD